MINELLENEIVNHLLHNKEYFSEVMPFLEQDFFTHEYSIIYKHIKNFYSEYDASPSIKELVLSFKNSPKTEREVIKTHLQHIKEPTDVSHEMLIHLTEKFIKRKIFEKSIIKGAEALSKNNEDEMTESYELAEQSVKVSLESDTGIEFSEIDKLDFSAKMGIKTGIKSFDRMIGDGYVSKTLHSILAASGIGKSAALVSFACNFARQGHDVVILSLEMSESEFYKRIYANLLHIKIQDIPNTPKSNFKMLIQKIKPGLGKIIVKEFPAGSLSPLGVDSFLTKLKNERGIDKPIVMVDYLGIMKSDRMKNSDNSYTYYGSVAEELRAVAQKRNIVIFSPLQLNRGAVNNLEADQSNLSESMRIFMSLDSAFIIAQTQEMKETSEMKIIFVKNRMSGKTRAFDIFYDYEFFEFADKNYDDDLDENITEHNVQKDDINQFTNEIDSLLSV